MFNKVAEFYNKLSKQEKIFVWGFIFFVVCWTAFPWLYANLTAGELTNAGISGISGFDKPVYYSLINQAAEGQILLKNLYTPGPQIGLFSPLWLVLGWLKALTGLSAITIYQLSRIIFLLCFFWLIYFLLVKTQKEIKWRWLGLALTFMGGLGTLTVFREATAENIEKYFGIDIWISEANILSTVNHSALFILSQALLIIYFYWLAEKASNLPSKGFWKIILLVLFLGLIHPYDLVIMVFVTSCWFVYQWLSTRQFPVVLFKRLALIGLIIAIVGGYFLLMAKVDLGFAEWAKQNITPSPQPFIYLIGYAFLLPLFVIGFKSAWQTKNKLLRLLCLWGVVVWPLIYLPLAFQRRLINGVAVAFLIVGVYGLQRIWLVIKKWSLFYKSSLLTLFIILASLTPLFIMGIELDFLAARTFPAYLSQDLRLAFVWLENLPGEAVVLSSQKTGNLIPAWTNKVVYLGHGHQSAQAKEKKVKIESWFYATNNDDQAKASWLRNNKIDYVIFSVSEKKFGDFQPSQKNYLELVFQQGEIAIYKVQK